MNKNKTKHYLRYALGEIILVVVGILIALAINDWNSKRIDQKNIQEYYKKMQAEIDVNLLYFDRQIANRQGFKSDALEVLNILKGESLDSISNIIDNVGAVRNINSISIDFPIVDEFLAQNYLSKIENDSIKSLLIEFSSFIKFTELVDSYTIAQYQTSIEPFFIKNFNYFEIAYDDFEDVNITGGPSTKIENLKDNLELWNIIGVKLETWEYELANLRWGKRVLLDLKATIVNELN